MELSHCRITSVFRDFLPGFAAWPVSLLPISTPPNSLAWSWGCRLSCGMMKVEWHTCSITWYGCSPAVLLNLSPVCFKMMWHLLVWLSSPACKQTQANHHSSLSLAPWPTHSGPPANVIASTNECLHLTHLLGSKRLKPLSGKLQVDPKKKIASRV